jgi:glutamate:GABA antiporter
MFVRRRHRPRATLAGASAPARPVQSAAHSPAPKLISWTALALLTVGSVGNLGSASALAVVGLASVFLYVLPALVFLVPVSLVAAELAGAWPGGVYNWVSQGISAPMGLLAVWCEFAQTIFFYPALLAYVADTLAYPSTPAWPLTVSTPPSSSWSCSGAASCCAHSGRRSWPGSGRAGPGSGR